MLRRITSNKQLTIPKEFMERLHLREGDCVNIDCDNSCIRLQSVTINDFFPTGYKKLAAKLECMGISFLSTCRGGLSAACLCVARRQVPAQAGIYDARYCGFDKSNPYRSAPKVRYVHQLKKENGTCCYENSDDVRKHLKRLMK